MRSVPFLALTAVLALATACTDSSHSGPPQLLATQVFPAAGAVVPARQPVVLVSFNRELDPASISTDQIEVRTARGPVAGATTSASGRQLRFQSADVLPYGTTITATLQGGLRTADGLELADPVTWSYRIGDGALRNLALPVADASPTRRCIVTALAGRPEFAAALGSDLWLVSSLPPNGVVPPPTHETFPFAADRTVPSLDGSIAAVQVVDRGTLPAPDLFLLMATRRPDGTWQNDDVRVMTGTSATLFRLESGGDGAVITQLIRSGAATLRMLVGPRPNAPVLAAFDTTSFDVQTTLAAIDLDTAVRCDSSATQGQPATFTRYDLTTPTPTAQATWSGSFGLVAPDRAGKLLVLAEENGQLSLTRRNLDGVAEDDASVPAPSTLPLAVWRVLPANGTAAAIAARFGECSSFRLDASEATPQVRTFPMSQDAIDTGGWDACCAPGGDLLVAERVRATSLAAGSLVLWRQRPGRNWESQVLLAEDSGRALGRPGIAVDANGLVAVAVPRGTPAEMVVLQWQQPLQ